METGVTLFQEDNFQRGWFLAGLHGLFQLKQLPNNAYIILIKKFKNSEMGCAVISKNYTRSHSVSP